MMPFARTQSRDWPVRMESTETRGETGEERSARREEEEAEEGGRGVGAEERSEGGGCVKGRQEEQQNSFSPRTCATD